MSNCLKAVLISFAAHALVSFALAFWIGHAAAIEIEKELAACTPKERETILRLVRLRE